MDHNPMSKLSNTARTLLGIAAYQRSGRTPPFAYQSMIQLFCQTGGASNDAFSSVLGWTKKPYGLPDNYGVLGDLSAEDVGEIGEDLKNKGFHVFKQRLPEKLCDDLLKFATASACIRRGKDGEGVPDVEVSCFPRGAADAVRYDFSEQALVNNPLVQSLMADKSIISVAQSYLGSKPIVDVVAMWWNAASAAPDKQAAQFWHFDMDRIKWVKFFIYLTDVGPNNGPHSFITGTHRRGGMPEDLLSKGYSRLSDDEVQHHFGVDKFVEFTAPRGTVIAEDTRGLHKGKHVTAGDRLLLQLQFSNSLFGGTYPDCRITTVEDQGLRGMVANYPQIYSNYLRR